jgi:hypothetical protein
LHVHSNIPGATNMTILLAIDALTAVLDAPGSNPQVSGPQPAPHGAPAASAIGAAGESAAPERFVPVAPTLAGSDRHRWVEALVTFAIMAWFTAALAWMVGELYGGPSGPLAEIAVTTIAPASGPQVTAGSGTTSI